MKPEINTIFCGDHLEILNGFLDNSIDITVTSPPYDKLRDYEGYCFNFKALVAQLYRITKQGGVVVWVVGDATIKGSETGSSFRQALYFNKIGFNIHDTMIYEKNSFSFPARNRYDQIFEFMFIFSKGKPKTINLIKDKKNKYGGQSTWGNLSKRGKDGSLTSINKKILIKEFGNRTNIWRYNTGKGFSASNKIAFEHPAIFPEQLAKDHIITWSNKGDIVLDPMCGSGTTCLAAQQLKRDFIGIDVSRTYCEITRKRLGLIPSVTKRKEQE